MNDLEHLALVVSVNFLIRHVYKHGWDDLSEEERSVVLKSVWFNPSWVKV